MNVNHSPKLLEMHKISKSFPGVLALDNVDFDLNSGEVHALIGENGAGKSTLMKILSGAHQTDTGMIRMEGRTLKIHNPRIAQDSGISTIYQEFNLIPHLSIASNIFLGREPQHFAGFINRTIMYDETKCILDELGLSIDPDILVRNLNVAQQQMVEVAKALIYHAKILIMDEPTSALTTTEIETLFATIKRIQQKGVGIIYISHRLEELFQIADRVTVLRDGKTVGMFKISEVNKKNLIRLMADRDLKEYYPRIRSKVGKTILKVSQMSRGNYLKEISFHLKQGEILGIAGLLGAGRTELARAIFGVDRIESGEIFINDFPAEIASPRKAIKTGIGFLTEDRKQLGLILKLSVKDNISLPNLDKFSKYGFLKKKDQKNISLKFIEEFRIKTPGVNQKVINLSGGNQQKVVLSKWIARKLDILIFDEPTRGIDVTSKVEIYNLMNQLTAQGVGIIMISSELPEILGMSDRILVMHNGKITAEFDANKVTQETLLTKALGEVA